MTRDEIEEYCEYNGVTVLLLDGQDNAFIGFDKDLQKAVYDEGIIIDNLIKDGMTEEDAWEYYHFKIAGAYVDEQTPIIIKVL